MYLTSIAPPKRCVFKLARKDDSSAVGYLRISRLRVEQILMSSSDRRHHMWDLIRRPPTSRTFFLPSCQHGSSSAFDELVLHAVLVPKLSYSKAMSKIDVSFLVLDSQDYWWLELSLLIVIVHASRLLLREDLPKSSNGLSPSLPSKIFQLTRLN